jgi:hypothetical protein
MPHVLQNPMRRADPAILTETCIMEHRPAPFTLSPKR